MFLILGDDEKFCCEFLLTLALFFMNALQLHERAKSARSHETTNDVERAHAINTMRFLPLKFYLNRVVIAHSWEYI